MYMIALLRSWLPAARLARVSAEFHFLRRPEIDYRTIIVYYLRHALDLLLFLLFQVFDDYGFFCPLK